jgi:N-acetylneuraminic acid mutarotase
MPAISETAQAAFEKPSLNWSATHDPACLRVPCTASVRLLIIGGALRKCPLIFRKPPKAHLNGNRYSAGMIKDNCSRRWMLLVAAFLHSWRLLAAESYAPLPNAVTSFGAAVHNGWLYVYGGHLGERHHYSSNEVTGAFHRLNLIEGKTWETLPPGAPAQSPAFVADGDYIYRIGGMAARNPKGQTNDVWSRDGAARFNLKAGEWEELPSLPSPRSSHDGWAVDGHLYVAGGWTLAGKEKQPVWASTILVLDLSAPKTKWAEIPQPFKRRGLAMTAIGSRLYCIGGMDDHNSPTSAVSIFDTSTQQWTEGPNLPDGEMKGFGASVCVVNRRLYVSGLEGVLWRLKDMADGWEDVGHLASPRFFHRLTPGVAGQILAIGGENDDAKLNDIEIISVKSNP